MFAIRLPTAVVIKNTKLYLENVIERKAVISDAVMMVYEAARGPIKTFGKKDSYSGGVYAHHT